MRFILVEIRNNIKENKYLSKKFEGKKKSRPKRCIGFSVETYTVCKIRDVFDTSL